MPATGPHTFAPPSMFKPTEFVSQLVAAVVPTVDTSKEGWSLNPAPEDEMFHCYRALVPFLGDFTVADAALLLPMLYAASDCDLRDPGSDEDLYFEARGRIRDLVEDFISDAAASTPACVSARAYILNLPADNKYCHPSEFNVEGMKSIVKRDIERLRSGRFNGQTFGAGRHKEMPDWFHNSTRRLDEFKSRH